MFAMTMQQNPVGADNGLRREVLSWVRGLLLAVPVFIGLWFITGVVHGPWLQPLLTVLAIGPLLGIGWASRSSLWELLVWLAPLLVVLGLGLALPTTVGLAVLTAVAIVWTAGVMLYSSINARVLGWADHVFIWLVDISLPAPKRSALRAFRSTLKRNLELRQAPEQLEDSARTAKGLRDMGSRFQGIAAPDSRWKEMLESFAIAPLRYADMLEGRERMDYDEVNRLMERRDPLLRQLLRQESWAYRILTWVPRH
jgi:hypothetical protein